MDILGIYTDRKTGREMIQTLKIRETEKLGQDHTPFFGAIEFRQLSVPPSQLCKL